MASPRSKTVNAAAATSMTSEAPPPPPPPPPAETQSIFPRARQDPQQQSQRHFSSPSLRSRSLPPDPQRLSAPHSTVVTTKITDGEASIPPSSSDTHRFGGSSSAAASTNRHDGTTASGVCRRLGSSSNAVSDDDDDNDGDGARKRKVVVVVESDVVSLRGGTDVSVHATRAGVRWGRRSKAGQPQQLTEGSDGRWGDREGADGSRVSSTTRSSSSSSPTITFLSDDIDDPPVTRQISSDGGPFRRPGRFTYIVSSGPLTVGRVVVSEAPNEADTDERYSRRAMAVDNDVDHDPVAAAAASLIPAPLERPEKSFAPAAFGGAAPVGAPRVCGPPDEEEEEDEAAADGEGRRADDSRKGKSDKSDDGNAAALQNTTKAQEAHDEQQQQQQQDEQEEEEKAMAADELSPVHARKLPQPPSGLGEPSVFLSTLEIDAPWRGDQAAMETAEDSCKTPMAEEVAAGLPGPLPLLRVPPCEPSLPLPACCGDANDCNGDPVTISKCLVEQDRSIASPSLIAPPPSLDTEGGGQTPRRGIGEGTTVRPTAEAPPEDCCDRRDSSIECPVPMEERRPTVSSPTEEEEEEEEEEAQEAQEVEGATDALKTGSQRGHECRDETPGREDGERDGDEESDPADHGYVDGGGNKGGRSVLYISASSSEAGDGTTPQTSIPATSSTSGARKKEEATSVASFRPEGGDAEPDPSSQEREIIVVDMEEPRLETTAAEVACEGAPTSGPSGCTETGALVHSGGGGFTGGVGKIDYDDEPDGVLSDNSCIDSDDGTAATSQSAKEGVPVDKRPSLPLPLSPEATSSGVGAGGSELSYLPGAVLEPRPAQFPPPIQIGPVLSSDGAEILPEDGDGGVTRQEWHGGMSPLTSPAVGARLGGDVRGGFDCSEDSAAVFSLRAATSDRASEDGQQLLASKVDGGPGEGENDNKEHAVFSNAERAGMVEPAAAATVSLEMDDHASDGDGTFGVIRVVSGNSPRKSFNPEKVRVPVGATVVWQLHGDVMPDGDGSGAGPVCETFHVRQDTPICDNGFVTECEFSLVGSKHTYSHVFQQEGLFIMCSKTSPSDDGTKRGEIFVGGTGSVSQSQGEILLGRTESLSQSQGDSSSFDPDSVGSADHERFRYDNEDSSSGGHSSFEHDNQRSPAMQSDVSHFDNSPTVSSCPVGDERSRCSDARGARATPSTESDVALRGFSATGVPARRSVGTTAPPEFGMDKAILAATAAATVGQAKSVAESLRISSEGRYRGVPPLVGVHATGDVGGRVDTCDGPGRQSDRESVLGQIDQKTGGGASRVTESLSAAVVVSPQRSPPTTSGMLPTTGTTERRDQCNGGGVGDASSDRGGIGSDSHRSLDETDFDGNKTTRLEVRQLEPRAPRVDAGVQSGELLSPTSAVIAKVEAAPNETAKRQLGTDANTPIDAEGEGMAPVVGESQERERVGHATENISSKSKKKKPKKKKKKSGGGGGAGDGGDGGIGIGIGIGVGVGVGVGDGCGGGGGESGCTDWDMHGVGSQNDSALLIDEQSSSYIFTGRAVGARGGVNGKSVAKTLIVGDQGFKPTKALVVQAGAAVSIKVASVRRNRAYGQDRALSISLEIPVVHTLERFVEGRPRQTVLKKTNAFGDPLVAVFRRPGEYWLVDHFSGKRLKVTATERPEDLLQAGAAAAADFNASAASRKGRKDELANASSSSFLRYVDSCSSEGGKNVRGERVASSSRSKKKNKGKDKLAAATAVTAAAAAALAANTVATSTKEALDRTEAAHLAGVPGVARASEAPAGATTAPPPPPPLPLPLTVLPPIRVKEGGDGLSLDELVEYNQAAKHSTLEGVHVVSVSHQRGFEPATLEVGLTPGLGACIMCDLDFQQQVTREVVCTRLMSKETEGSSAKVEETSRSAQRGGRGGPDPPGTTGDDNEDAGKYAEKDEDDPNVKTARLGPGSLRKCHFILGQYGTYRLSYRNEANKGLLVVVRPPPLSDEGEGSARDGGMVAFPSAGDRSFTKEDVVKPPSSGEVDVSGEGEHRDSAAAVPCDNDSDATSGSTVTSVKSIEPPHTRSADGSSSDMAMLDQWPSVGESSAVGVAAAGGTFSLESGTDCDHGQGDFVHQRSQVKKKNKRLKRNTAAAAAAAAAAKEAATKKATAVAGSVTGVVTDGPTGWDQAVVTARPPTGSSAAALPRDDATVGVSRAALTLPRQRETRLATTFSNRTVVGGDDDTALVPPVSWTLAQMPTSTSQNDEIAAEGSCAEAGGFEAAAASPGSAAVGAPGSVSATGADSGNVEQNLSGHGSISLITPAPVLAQEALTRNLSKEGPVREDSSSGTTIDRAALKCEPLVPTAAVTVSAEKEGEQQEAAAPATATGAVAGTSGVPGGRGATGTSRGGKKGTNVPPYDQIRARPAGWNPPGATSPDGTLPHVHQLGGQSLHRRWDNPPAAVFPQPRPSHNLQRVGEKRSGAPSVPGGGVQAAGGESGAPGFSAQPSTSCVESGGWNPAHLEGERPSGWGERVASTKTAALLSPSVTAAAPESVSGRMEPSHSHHPVTEAANSPCPQKGVSSAQRFRGATEFTELCATADKDALPRPHTMPGQSAAMNALSDKGNCADRREKTLSRGSAWASSTTGAMEDGRFRAAESSSDPPKSPFALSASASSANDARATASKLKKKQKKKAKVAESRKVAGRKAAERKTAVVVSTAEEPMQMSPGKSSAFVFSRLSESSVSSSRQQPPVALPPLMAGGCSAGEVLGVRTGADESRATSTAVQPGSPFGNSGPLGRVTTVNHPNEAGAPTSLSSSRRHVPLAMPATSRAAGFDGLTVSGGSITRTSSLPGPSSGGWKIEGRGDIGQAAEKGFPFSAETAGLATSGGHGGVGPGRAPRGGLRHPPPPGLARSRSEADGGWGSAATAVATVFAAAPVPAAATTLDQAEAQPLPRPPSPGLGGEYLPAARAPPYGDVKPSAATAAEGTMYPTVILAREPKALAVIPTPGTTSEPVGSGGICCGGTHSAAQQGGTGFGNCSTKVSFDERSRRNRVLRAGATPFFPAAHSHGGRRGYRPVQAKPSAFPEGSRLPGGGYYVEEGPDDTLPPPSAYEVQEAAYMMKVYDDMMERLRTTGMDETLPNGFTPRIYDFTDGVCC